MVIGSHAVVVGAGIGGLFMARVLSEFYERVTLLERDVLSADGGARGGVPQGRHLHALLTGGTQVLRELFPGLFEELVAQGAPTGDVLANGRWYFGGCRFARGTSGLPSLSVTRPHLENAVRAWLSHLDNVQIADGCAVVGLLASPDTRHVTGVRVVHRAGGILRDTRTRSAGAYGKSVTRPGLRGERALDADLVVDASGRGSPTPRWLAEMGYSPPWEERVHIDIGYASCSFRMPVDALGGDLGVVTGATTTNLRAGGMGLMAGGRWLVSLAGYLGHHPPVTSEGFLAFAAALPAPDIHDAIRTAAPLDRPVRYRLPDAVRRHYERLPRFPEGLLVVADAACSFNPLYGQGMSVAAQQALILRRYLRRGQLSPGGLRREVAHAGSVAWQMSVSSDLRLPGIHGRRRQLARLGNVYTARLLRAARHDAVVGRTFMRVANLVDPPSRVFRPGVALRVLAANASHARGAR